jgi:6-pyruvoyltetrahydropterin/6-carboxytetrahydropterin synthase
MQPARRGVADIHARPTPNVFHVIQHLDFALVIVAGFCRFGLFCRLVISHEKCSALKAKAGQKNAGGPSTDDPSEPRNLTHIIAESGIEYYNPAMLRLTREVRFAINQTPAPEPPGIPTNNYAGFPSLAGLGHYFALQVTIAGHLDAQSNYLQNIKLVDSLVRERCVPAVDTAVRSKQFGGGGNLFLQLFDVLKDPWPNITLDAMQFSLSPFLSISILASEYPMIRLSQKFEFCASHRLYNPALSEEQNRQTFGKCSNPHGHGHNYELQVTLRGKPDPAGVLMPIPAFERIVAETILDRFDHKNLNIEIPEFRQLIPSVENIAMVIYRLLKPRFTDPRVELASVTVWETAKTWCEYSGE